MKKWDSFSSCFLCKESPLFLPFFPLGPRGHRSNSGGGFHTHWGLSPCHRLCKLRLGLCHLNRIKRRTKAERGLLRVNQTKHKDEGRMVREAGVVATSNFKDKKCLRKSYRSDMRTSEVRPNGAANSPSEVRPAQPLSHSRTISGPAQWTGPPPEMTDTRRLTDRGLQAGRRGHVERGCRATV